MRYLIATAAAAALFAGSASAQELKVNPGKWQTNSTFSVTVSANGQTETMPPESETATECWKTSDQTTLTPSMLVIDGCQVLNPTGNAYRLAFDLSCNVEGIPMTGNAVITVGSDKNSTDGTINLYANIPGVSVSANGKLIGKRIGTC